MKKLSIVLLAGIFVLPGCWPKKRQKAKEPTVSDRVEKELVVAEAYEPLDETASFFDADVEEFVLEEESDANIFEQAPDDVETKVAQLEEDAVEFDWQEHREEEEADNIKPIFFGFDRHSIASDQKEALETDLKVAKKMTDDGRTVVVEGHACHSAGSKTYNYIKAENRAHAIAQCAEEYGIPKEQIKVVSRGDTMPIVHGGDCDEQAPNRRVEIFAPAA